MSRGVWRLVVSFLGFDAGWTAAVLLASRAEPMLGAGVAIGVGAGQLALRGRWRRDIPFTLAAAAVGTAADAALIGAGLLRFHDGSGPSAIFLFWIFALWINFASTVNICFRWLRGRWWLGAAIGAVAGPLTYLAGAKLGAVRLPDDAWASFVAVAVEYAVLTPALVWAGRRWADGETRGVTAGGPRA